MLVYENIISEGLINHNQLVLNNDEESEILTYYLHLNKGLELLEGEYVNLEDNIINKSEDILINSVGHSTEDIEYIRSVFSNLDPLIDLDFEEMDNYNGSTIDIYSISDSSSFTFGALGQTITRKSNLGAWWEILWKDTDGKKSTNSSDQNTIIHEIGHSLGLAHPNDDPFDESFNSFDTVMTYNNNGIDTWNNQFSVVDILALQKIWGRENDNGVMNFIGKYSDYKYDRNGQGLISINTKTGPEIINNLKILNFKDKSIDVQKDILPILNAIKSIDEITGIVFRLYDVFLNRFPDHEGFMYWTNNYSQGIDSYEVIKKSFFNKSDTFGSLTMQSQKNEVFLKTTYQKMLNRDYDINGYNYWLNQLNNQEINRKDLLFSFFESDEHKDIYSNILGLNNFNLI
tara:strand:+ start:2883 stop:4088 length:1206 start_codon:yes stop_codon:yes gene_type:complete